MTAQGNPSLAYLLDRVQLVERKVRAAVEKVRETDPKPDDPLRGLFLNQETIDRIINSKRLPFDVPAELRDHVVGQEASANQLEQQGAVLRLRRLARTAGLNPLDIELLLIALTPDVDSRFGQLLAYLNDEVSIKRASIGVALRLAGAPEAAAPGRSRLDDGAPLVAAGLIAIGDRDRPFLNRTLRVPDRVVAHLLGDDRADPTLAGVVLGAADLGVGDRVDLSEIIGLDPEQAAAMPGTDRLGKALAGPVRLAYLRERPGGSGLALGAAGIAAAGRAVVCVDAVRLAAEPDPVSTARSVLREAVLRDAGIVIGPLDGLEPANVLATFTRLPVPIVTYGTGPWNPHWSDRAPMQLVADAIPASLRASLWRGALAANLAEGVDPAEATAHFVLGPPQIRRAADAAVLAAHLDDHGVVSVEHVRYGARTQNAAGLERLARRTEPGVTWDDLVLPAGVIGLLHELSSRAHYRERVLDEWRMRPGGGRGRGVAGLFAGDSGTGKTMSAEVIAADLGMDLYTVNLATVVDKYVGETEKNLERIFTEAAGVNGVLFFDEADAIFGKRSEVKDAHDRYANIESAYLLQRMETFDGLVILATNLRSNLDEAFTRRLDVMVDFPTPDEEYRRLLWDRCLGRNVPRADDLDLDFLAAAFELAGGHIRSATVTAAYLAAEANQPVGMGHLVGAVAREYRKLGRLTLESEFGPYLELVTEGWVSS